MVRPKIRFRKSALVAIAATAVMALGACAGGTTSSSTTSATADANATGEALPTVTKGKLTIATGDPAYSPWVLNDNPESGEGYEAAVAYAVAEKLGFSKDQVVWKRTTFDSAIAPGAKDWDFNIQQFSITDARKQAVDFSSPYYTTSQAVVALKNGKGSNAKSVADLAAAEAKSLEDLKKLKFGVQAGTTSQNYVMNKLKPSVDPLVFNGSADVVQALKGGQVDAIVVDLPTAFNVIATQVDNGTVVGQFTANEDGNSFGLLLPKGSALTPAVTKAVDKLRDNGTLAELQKKWLADAASAPIFEQ